MFPIMKEDEQLINIMAYDGMLHTYLVIRDIHLNVSIWLPVVIGDMHTLCSLGVLFIDHHTK